MPTHLRQRSLTGYRTRLADPPRPTSTCTPTPTRSSRFPVQCQAPRSLTLSPFPRRLHLACLILYRSELGESHLLSRGQDWSGCRGTGSHNDGWNRRGEDDGGGHGERCVGWCILQIWICVLFFFSNTDYCVDNNQSLQDYGIVRV